MLHYGMLLALRIWRQYIWRCESLLSLLFLYFLWCYLRWLGGGGAETQQSHLFRSTAKPLNDEILAYLSTPKPLRRKAQASSKPDWTGLMRMKSNGARFWDVRHNIAFYAAQGMRESMEDRASAFWDPGDEAAGTKDIQAFAVYDGHGGAAVATYLESVFLKTLIKETRAAESKLIGSGKGDKAPDVAKLFRQLIPAMDEKIMKESKGSAEITGSTLVAVLIYDERWLTVANVGDSRAVYADAEGKAHNLTRDHKPSDPREKANILAKGGSVEFFGVWRVNGILAMSRSMADAQLKRLGVISAVPDVDVYDLRKERWPMLVLASDGLWDVVGAEEAVASIMEAGRREEPRLSTEQLTDEAINRQCLDNVSILVLRLPAWDLDKSSSE